LHFSENAMPKNAIQTLLLTCLLIASTAQAQSKLNVYGRLNLATVHYRGYGLANPTLTSQNNLASRIGFKGMEELGNGLSAFFVIESSLSPDTGSATLGGRETSLGLQGNFGKLRLGYMLTPLDDFHSVAGPGWVTNVSNDTRMAFGAMAIATSIMVKAKPAMAPSLAPIAATIFPSIIGMEIRCATIARFSMGLVLPAMFH
jgi:predicted porin